MTQQLNEDSAIDLSFILLTAIGTKGVAKALEVRKGHIALRHLPEADILQHVGVIAFFPLFTCKSFLSDNLLCEIPFSTSHFPVLVQLSAETVSSAPFPVILDCCQAEVLNVIEKITIRIVGRCLSFLFAHCVSGGRVAGRISSVAS